MFPQGKATPGVLKVRHVDFSRYHFKAVTSIEKTDKYDNIYIKCILRSHYERPTS